MVTEENVISRDWSLRPLGSNTTRSHASFTKLSTNMNRVIATAAPSENNSCAEPRLSAVLARLIVG
jgi:hypothetical protein